MCHHRSRRVVSHSMVKVTMVSLSMVRVHITADKERIPRLLLLLRHKTVAGLLKPQGWPETLEPWPATSKKWLAWPIRHMTGISREAKKAA